MWAGGVELEVPSVVLKRFVNVLRYMVIRDE